MLLMSRMDAVAQAYIDAIPGFSIKGGKSAPLYLFNDAEDYHRFLGSLGIDSRGSGGMFFASQIQGGLTTWVADQPEEWLFHVLQHEGFHHFANLRIGGQFPIWANEGLAEYFGHGQFVRRKLRLGVAPSSRIERLRSAIEANRFFPLDEFLRMSAGEWNQRVRTGDPRAGVQYDQAWALIHFLLHSENGRYRRALYKYIQATSEGRDLEVAAREAFGSSEFGAFERKWIDYIKKLEADPVSTAIERLSFLGAGLRELHVRGRRVASFDELEIALKEIDFEHELRDLHGTRNYSAADDSLFDPPPSTNTRRLVEYVFKIPDNTDDDKPLPTIEVTGLGLRVFLRWSVQEDGNPTPHVHVR